MYRSIIETNEDFLLFVFAFDDICYDVLEKLSLEHVKVIPLSDFETDVLKSVKTDRSQVEYCWTCTPFAAMYILEHYPVSEIAYLDADLYFFKQPDLIMEEFRSAECDVLLTKHNYASKYSHLKKDAGIYCVQFMIFRNNENGRNILHWWGERCLEWCYATQEEGKFGDQKYLDDWTTRFKNVYVSSNKGAGVAPWNISKYILGNGPTVDNEDVVFYHFHSLLWYDEKKFHFADAAYILTQNVIEYVYVPYIISLQNELLHIRKIYDSEFNCGILSCANFENNYETINVTFEQITSIKKSKSLLIYGAGTIARKVIKLLDQCGVDKFHIVVTSPKDDEYIFGNKVYAIKDFVSQSENSMVLVAVGSKWSNEINNNLYSLGFTKIINIVKGCETYV